MKLFAFLIKRGKKVARKTEADFQREAHVKQTEEQFQKLVNKGLQVPIALL